MSAQASARRSVVRARWLDEELVVGTMVLCTAVAVPSFVVALIVFGAQFPAWARVLPVLIAALGTVRLVAREWGSRLFFAYSVATLLGLGLLLMVTARDAIIATEAHDRIERRAQIDITLDDYRDRERQLEAGLTQSLTAAQGALVDAIEAPPAFAEDSYGAHLLETAQAVLSTPPADPSVEIEQLTIERDTADPKPGPKALALFDVTVAALDAQDAKSSFRYTCRNPPTGGGATASEADHAAAPTATSSTPSTAVTPDQLVELEIELARCKAAVTGADEDVQALRDLELARVAPGEPPTVDAFEALQRGPDEVLRSFTHDDIDPPLAPGVVGWTVLGVLLLGFWLRCARANASAQTGSVDVSAITNTDFKIALLRNVTEPGATPGSASTAPVTDLLGIVDPTKKLKELIDAVLKVVGRHHAGYKVAIEHVELKAEGTTVPAVTGAAAAIGTATPTSRHEVLVKLTPVVGDGAITRSVTGDSEPAAMRAAGYLAAAEVLRRSRRVPSWSRWSPGSEGALATASAIDVSIGDLESAVRLAPDSGLLLTRLGAEREQAGKPIEAIELYARAVAAHPRYQVARYRLAGSLNMLWLQRDQWTSLTVDRKRSVREGLYHASCSAGVEMDELPTTEWLTMDDASARAASELLSKPWFEQMARDAGRLRHAANTLRRSERDSMWPPRRDSNAERRLWLARSLLLLAGVPDHRSALITHAAKRTSWWQVSYNLACYYSRRGAPNEALQYLELALLRPGIEQLTAAWAKADPDLKVLAGEPRFIRFCTKLKED